MSLPAVDVLASTSARASAGHNPIVGSIGMVSLFGMGNSDESNGIDDLSNYTVNTVLCAKPQMVYRKPPAGRVSRIWRRERNGCRFHEGSLFFKDWFTFFLLSFLGAKCRQFVPCDEKDRQLSGLYRVHLFSNTYC